MKKIFAFVTFALLAAAVGVQSQVALEQTSRSISKTPLFTAASRDSLIARLSGTSAIDSTGVLYRSPYTGFTFVVSGTSPDVSVILKCGNTSPSDNVSLTDSTDFNFVADDDTLAIDSAGVHLFHVDAPITSNIYAIFEAGASNGSDTEITGVIERSE